MPAAADGHVLVRSMRDDEARLFLALHARAVRGLAAEHYPPEVIEGGSCR